MIFPFLNGIYGLKRAPVTWAIFFLNALVLVFSYTPWVSSQAQLDERLQDPYFLSSQGRLYARFISEHGDFYSPLLREVSHRVLDGDNDKLELLGSLALRNKRFVEEAPAAHFTGDQVAIRHWKRDLASITVLKDQHPNYVLGLSSEDVSGWKWMSYIFVHSGPVHFLGNMLFLLIFSCWLEPLVGGLAVLILFLVSGVFAAGFYLLVSGATAAPLIGASGAVSGIMAFFCFLYWNKPVRFVYWLFLPLKGYSGFIYLPGWVIFALWVASDAAGYWATLDDFGGVAYGAHLGGEIIGLTAGLLLSLLRRRYAGAEMPYDKVEIGKVLSF
jgi:membrane associated rhomboid family serine protease